MLVSEIERSIFAEKSKLNSPLYFLGLVLIIFLYIAIREAGTFSLDAHAKKKRGKEKAGLMALYLLVMGGGPWSLDKYFAKKRKKVAEHESKKSSRIDS